LVSAANCRRRNSSGAKIGLRSGGTGGFRNAANESDLMIACLLCSTVYELQARAALVSYLTLEIVFGETLYDLARNRTDSPSAFRLRTSAI
jgi:hypothetical protein